MMDALPCETTPLQLHIAHQSLKVTCGAGAICETNGLCC
jgi:hypothetical protein